MGARKRVIVGCGDIGQRVAQQLITESVRQEHLIALVRSERSVGRCLEMGLHTIQTDFDKKLSFAREAADHLKDSELIYLVPPANRGTTDQRSQIFLRSLIEQASIPSKIVLISTTAVYGNCDGEWITEQREPNPVSERGKRRLDAERQWREFSEVNSINITVLRVPGIYSNDRIPRQRIIQGEPVLNAAECGFTNRIHVVDLVTVVIAAIKRELAVGVINVADGTPSKMTDYLQSAAKVIGVSALPEISLNQARLQFSEIMLSYLTESRKIDNQRMLRTLKVALRYPDYRIGLRH